MWVTSGHSNGKNKDAVCNALANQISDISLSIIVVDSFFVFINLNSVPIQKYPTVNSTIFSNNKSFDNSWLTFFLVESFKNDKRISS